MTPDEHLDLILTHCRKLLDIAGKRTPGEWYVDKNGDIQAGWPHHAIHSVIDDVSISREDSAFIASAAGNFESALMTTIESIEFLRQMVNFKDTDGKSYGEWCNNDGRGCGPCEHAHNELERIRAAWPVERLTK